MSKDIRRREFLILAAAALAAVGVAKTAPAERIVDAGPASGYSNDGVYAGFRDQDSLSSAEARNFLHFPRSALSENVSCRPRQTDLSTASAMDRRLIRMGR